MSALLISGGLQAAGMLTGGIAAKNTAKLNAFNIETESVMQKAEGVQQSNLRQLQFEDEMSTANAFFSAAGRDVDRSVQAYMDKRKEVAGSDVGDIATMGNLARLTKMMEAQSTRRAGQEQFIGSLLRAGSTAANTYFDWKDTQ